MDNEYMHKIGKYKYRTLNYSGWAEYILKEYKTLRSKNLERKIKKQREQVKETPINFNW